MKNLTPNPRLFARAETAGNEQIGQASPRPPRITGSGEGEGREDKIVSEKLKYFSIKHI